MKLLHAISFFSAALPLGVVFAAINPVVGSASTIPAFGLTFFDQGSVCQVSAGCQYPNATTPPTNVDVENLQQLSYSDNFALNSLSTTSTFLGMIGGTQLHALSATGFPATGGVFDQGYYSAVSNADEYWFDTFNFSPGTYDVNLVFDGTLSENVPNGSVFDLVDTFNFLENGTVLPALQYSGIVATLSPGSQQSLQLSFSSPTSIVLGELLQIRNEVGSSDSSAAGGSVTIDDSDTGYFTVTASTPGASFTTASGETYSSASTPEPATWILLMAELCLLGLVARRRA